MCENLYILTEDSKSGDIFWSLVASSLDMPRENIVTLSGNKNLVDKIDFKLYYRGFTSCFSSE